MEFLFWLAAVPPAYAAAVYVVAVVQGLTDRIETLPEEKKPLVLMPAENLKVNSLASTTGRKELEPNATSIQLPREVTALVSKTSRRLDEALTHFTSVEPTGEDARELRLLETRLMENVNALRKSVPFGSTRASAEDEALFTENVRIINAAVFKIGGGSGETGRLTLRTLNNYLVNREHQKLKAKETEGLLEAEFTPVKKRKLGW